MLPTTPDRRPLFYRLLECILRQVNGYTSPGEIEILIDEDNREKSIGKKRQDLLEKATGIFVVGIDSDDYIHDEYISAIKNALIENPYTDHVGFIEDCEIDGKRSKSIFSIKHKSWDEHEPGYDQVRCANPKSVIRRTKALQIGFEDKRFIEDRIFSEQVTQILSSEVFIQKELYFYRHTSSPFNERYGFDR
jgi:hypothetical protein